jgi:hypothetical protein
LNGAFVDRFLTHWALTALDCSYWERADGRSTICTETLFANDGELLLGSMQLRGRTAIGDFFDRRSEQHAATQRYTRHFSSNLRIDVVEPGRACMRSLVMVFVGFGVPPDSSAAPATIADVEDLCSLDSDGNWKFLRRAITPTFIGAGAAKFTTPNPPNSN